MIWGRNEAPTTADDIPAARRDHVLPSIWRRLMSQAGNGHPVWGHLCCWPPDPGHSYYPGEEVTRGRGVIGGPGGGLGRSSAGHLRRECKRRRHCNYVDHKIHKYFDRTHCSQGEGGLLSLACCILHSSSTITILLYASIIVFPSPLNRSAVCLPFPDNLQQSKDEKLLLILYASAICGKHNSYNHRNIL